MQNPLTRLRRLVDLPLVAKELNELAARRQTYVVRFVYAALLFGGACVLFYGDLFRGAARGLGRGDAMFRNLVLYQFWGICLFLPATASGALTVEKERNALGLLMLTTLRPWEIVFQKYLSRLIPMVSFVLLSLPLMAIAYSYGGVTQEQLWTGIHVLFATCLQVGAISIMCSAFCRTTPEAFVATYVLLAVSYFLFPCFWAPAIVQIGGGYPAIATVATMWMLIPAVFCLLLARFFLVARAFVPPRNLLLEFFQQLDAVFNDLNRLTGGIVLVKDKHTYPRDDPVAWRETHRKSLGTFRYRFRVLAALELPVLVTCELMRYDRSGRGLNAVTLLLYVVWCVSVAMIAVHAASIISSERSRQTLDVLLTTPMRGAEILRQKFQGVRRLITVLLVPFVTIFVLENWWYGNTEYAYLVCSLASVLIYLPLTAWLATWIGLVVRSQMRAVLASILVLVCWAVVPPAVRHVLSNVVQLGDSRLWACIGFLSPSDVIRAIETSRPEAHGLPGPPWLFYTLHFVGFGVLWWTFRHLCLSRADQRLGRIADLV